MQKHSILLLVFLFCFADAALAQLYSTQYRAPGQNWMEINTERFRVIYPERYQDEAFRTLAILESDYPDIQELIGGELRRFPFIINPENDLSNGFVSPLNFRSEIELSPIVGKTMNPRSGDWLELVVPHELVHALHFNVNPFSFTRIMGLFSPDVRRSIHSAAPLGVFEGIAVHHESHGTIPGAGRGNHPFFRNQFNAHLDTRREWSMGQLLQVTDFTPPFDRHYIGGYEFTNWLLNSYGDETIKKAIDFHYKWPFLGFGTALRRSTGLWPNQLYDIFSEEKNAAKKSRVEKIEGDLNNFPVVIPFSGSCLRQNRPQWLDAETVLFFNRACNRTSGFYTYQVEKNRPELLHEVTITSDYIYHVDSDQQTITYSRYYADARYDNLFIADLNRFYIETGRSERLSENARLFSPEVDGDKIYAMQTVANEMELVAIDSRTNSIINQYSKPENSSVVQVAVNPHRKGQAAVIGRVKSVQALWFDDLETTERLFESSPTVVFESGSVYDITWHPTEEKLLFVSDHSGTMNIYEFNVPENSISQLTFSLHNAYEPAYSPDAKTIAFVQQDVNEHRVHLMETDTANRRHIPEAEWSMNSEIARAMERPLMNRQLDFSHDEWEPEPFKTGLGWLKPRFWAPDIDRIGGFDQIGVNFESVDVMSRQSYTMDVNHYADRVWGNITYTNKRFFPGFQLEAFNSPALAAFRVESEDESANDQFITLMQQSRGASLKVPVRYRLQSNVRFSSILIEPQYFISQIRFVDPFRESTPVSEFGTRHTIGLRSVFNYRVRQFIRDFQPNSGLVLFAEGRYGLNSDSINIDAGPLNTVGNLSQRKGFRAGVITYASPLSRWNQSLRTSAQVYSQTAVPVFNVISQYSDSFSEIPLLGANNVGILSNRYTIPLFFPDDGGLLIPVYLSGVYLVMFSQTVTDLNSSDLLAASRSVYGIGIRSRFRLSNMAIDIGFSIGWEPTRNQFTGYFGAF
ncbi:MAG: PD40 domain-containing protein [Balneolaceae bacterium]|nr:PD40 domain-containing protein [Balneolaceae bacterium]